MALSTATVAMFPSSTGAGGHVHVYDSGVNKAGLQADAYFAEPANTNANQEPRQVWRALRDFILKQAHSNTANGGVLLDGIASDGGIAPSRLWVNNGVITRVNR